MDVLVDTSVWIDYFRSGARSSIMDELIDENLIATNEMILAELVPFLLVKKQTKLVSLLYKIRRLSLHIDWENVIQCHVKCLQKGINGVGIPDLIIAQNSKHYQCKIYSLDNHFRLLKQTIGLDLFE